MATPMIGLEPKYCEQCGRNFYRPTDSDARFCSDHKSLQDRFERQKPMTSDRVRARLFAELQQALLSGDKFCSPRAIAVADALAVLQKAQQ